MNWLLPLDVVDDVYVRLKALAALAVTVAVGASLRLDESVLNNRLASRLSVACTVSNVVVEVKSLVTKAEGVRSNVVVVTKM